jgi:hypothetical protein
MLPQVLGRFSAISVVPKLFPKPIIEKMPKNPTRIWQLHIWNSMPIDIISSK